jgi:hypothetical protein
MADGNSPKISPSKKREEEGKVEMQSDKTHKTK